jgi:hypothetical protein
MGAGASSVHDPLGNALPVEPGQLLDEVLILQQDQSVSPSGLGILVIGDGGAGFGGEDTAIGHGRSPWLIHQRYLTFVLSAPSAPATILCSSTTTG